MIWEWETGEHRIVPFQGLKYGNIYKQHIQNLDNWWQYNQMTGDNTLEWVLQELLESAWWALPFIYDVVHHSNCYSLSWNAGDSFDDLTLIDDAAQCSLDFSNFALDHGGSNVTE